MLITVSTDASFSQRYQRGSYAFWISSNGGRFFNSGMLKHKVGSPILCEMKCIVNAFYFIVKYNIHADGIKRVIVNTDCLNAIHVFNDDKVSRKQYNLNSSKHHALYIKFKKYVMQNFKDVKIEFRHIKAHDHTDDAKHFVNDWCDRECKKHMGKFLESKNVKNILHGKPNGYPPAKRLSGNPPPVITINTNKNDATKN
jgi:hypothetical protein